ncbi:hypothetical protein I3842_05G106600 [Carya illinoinensis]|uniref:Uncharacterized protein n=1 Tax=Carya illinoinensis TaxID=32201 RepID=A0A922EY45_CARIL|nr:hypothetical protein I3842_05G106600 [Carya illinoinensis]
MYYFLYGFDDMFCDFCLQGKENITPIAQRSQITCDKLGMFVSPKSSVRMVGF